MCCRLISSLALGRRLKATRPERGDQCSGLWSANATGSPSTNAMLGLKHQWVGRPFRARRLMSLRPGLKHLGYSVRPLRGHRKMSKLQSAAPPHLSAVDPAGDQQVNTSLPKNIDENYDPKKVCPSVKRWVRGPSDARTLFPCDFRRNW